MYAHSDERDQLSEIGVQEGCTRKWCVSERVAILFPNRKRDLSTQDVCPLSVESVLGMVAQAGCDGIPESRLENGCDCDPNSRHKLLIFEFIIINIFHL